MALSSPLVLLAILLVTFLSLTLVRGKHWPDLSCHPAVDKEPSRDKYYEDNGKRWRSCQLSAAMSNKGMTDQAKCDKICTLEKAQQLFPFDHGIYLHADVIVNHVANENGYRNGLGGPEAEKLLKKIRSEMTKCYEKHPKLQNMHEEAMKFPCEDWQSLLSCIDDAFGCK